MLGPAGTPALRCPCWLLLLVGAPPAPPDLVPSWSPGRPRFQRAARGPHSCDPPICTTKSTVGFILVLEIFGGCRAGGARGLGIGRSLCLSSTTWIPRLLAPPSPLVLLLLLPPAPASGLALSSSLGVVGCAPSLQWPVSSFLLLLLLSVLLKKADTSIWPYGST